MIVAVSVLKKLILWSRDIQLFLNYNFKSFDEIIKVYLYIFQSNEIREVRD